MGGQAAPAQTLIPKYETSTSFTKLHFCSHSVSCGRHATTPTTLKRTVQKCRVSGSQTSSPPPNVAAPLRNRLHPRGPLPASLSYDSAFCPASVFILGVSVSGHMACLGLSVASSAYHGVCRGLPTLSQGPGLLAFAILQPPCPQG